MSPTSSSCAARASTTSRSTSSRSRSDQLVVFTGVSGSGKSSLAFDTLYAEGQRRYVESLSAYARQFLGQMEKPKYEQHPRPVADDRDRAEERVVATRARRSARSPRSTTTCACSTRAPASSAATSAAARSARALGGRDRRRAADAAARRRSVTLLAPQGREPQGRVPRAVRRARKAGFVRVRIDGMIVQRLEDVDRARQAEEAHDRARDRPRQHRRRRPGAPHRLGRDRAARGQAARCWSPSRARSAQRAYSRGARLPELRHRLPRAVAAALLVQQPARHVRRLQRPRRAHGGRSRPDRARPDALDPRRRDRGVGRARSRSDSGWTANIVKALAQGVRDRPRQAVEASSTTKQREVLLYGTGDKRVKVDVGGPALGGRVGDALRGHRQPARAPLSRDDRRSAMRQYYEQLLPRERLPRLRRPRACAPSRARCSSPARRSSTSPA